MALRKTARQTAPPSYPPTVLPVVNRRNDGEYKVLSLQFPMCTHEVATQLCACGWGYFFFLLPGRFPTLSTSAGFFCWTSPPLQSQRSPDPSYGAGGLSFSFRRRAAVTRAQIGQVARSLLLFPEENLRFESPGGGGVSRPFGCGYFGMVPEWPQIYLGCRDGMDWACQARPSKVGVTSGTAAEARKLFDGRNGTRDGFGMRG